MKLDIQGLSHPFEPKTVKNVVPPRPVLLIGGETEFDQRS
jgi:hypothetical protein